MGKTHFISGFSFKAIHHPRGEIRRRAPVWRSCVGDHHVVMKRSEDLAGLRQGGYSDARVRVCPGDRDCKSKELTLALL